MPAVGNAATSPPTGRASGSTTPPDGQRGCRACGLQAAGAAPIVNGAPVASPKPSPPPFASATRPAGGAPWPPGESGGLIRPSPTGDLEAYHYLAAREGISASRPAPPAWRGSSAPRRRSTPAGSRVICVLTGHGLRPDTAIQGLEAGTGGSGPGEIQRALGV